MAERLRSPPSGSRSRTNSHTPTKVKSPVPVLPPDAVDLIVEDKDAELKGGPGQRGALRRVYRKGFVASEDGKEVEGEIEVQQPDGEERVDVGEGILEAVVAEEAKHPGGGHRLPRDEEVLVKAESPPLHARVLMQEYDEDNPWA